MKTKTAKVIVITSGKGGVGKTTTSAAISAGIALKGHKTVVIDFDIGLRNLDLIMGCERRVIYDFVNVINGEANLNQALIKDKRVENLFILPASQTRDKDALTKEGIAKIIEELKKEFDYIICDSPAGIEKGALMALYYADEAIVVTNPEVSSVRDSDRILGVLASRSYRAENKLEPVKEHLLITRYSEARVKRGEMLAIEDVLEILSIPLLGVIPESLPCSMPLTVVFPSRWIRRVMHALPTNRPLRRLLGRMFPLPKPTSIGRAKLLNKITLFNRSPA